MYQITKKAYQLLGPLLGLDPQGVFATMQKEVVPTQELSNCLKAEHVDHYLFDLSEAPAASVSRLVQWRDISDWTSVIKNGEPITEDTDGPLVDDTLVILSVGLSLIVPANFTNGQMVRVLPTTTGGFSEVWFGDTNIVGVECVGPAHATNLPVRLYDDEIEAFFRLNEAATGPTFNWTVQVLAARRGILPPSMGL